MWRPMKLSESSVRSSEATRRSTCSTSVAVIGAWRSAEIQDRFASREPSTAIRVQKYLQLDLLTEFPVQPLVMRRTRCWSCRAAGHARSETEFEVMKRILSAALALAVLAGAGIA